MSKKIQQLGLTLQYLSSGPTLILGKMHLGKKYGKTSAVKLHLGEPRSEKLVSPSWQLPLLLL